MKVLIAEDDQLTRDGLAEVLRSEGYDVVTAADGSAAIDSFRNERPDFVCLDIMMPERSGYEACRIIREESPDVPIVFISAKAEEIDRLAGFDVGADDFIAKPFSVREVVARIRAVTRRYYRDRSSERAATFRLGDLEVIPAELRARRGDDVIDLSLRDVRLLQLFHNQRGRVLDRFKIFRHVWGEDYLPNSRSLDQHISQLRKRIEVNPRSPSIIRTVHGAGYRFDG